MTKSRGPSGAPSRRKRRGTSSSSENSTSDGNGILQHLQDIESQLRELAADRNPDSGPVTGEHTESAAQLEGIRQELERQSASMQGITAELQQFGQRFTADVAGAVDAAFDRAIRRSADVVAAEPPASGDVADTAAVDRQSNGLVEAPADGPVESSWAMIRQAMLDSSADESESPGADDDPVTEEQGLVEEMQESCPPQDFVEFAIPEPFDCETIEDEDLRAAFREREEILRQLSARLRQRLQPVATIPTEQLKEMAESLPDDLRECVTRSLGQLNEQLRLTELELSLERARMARQRTTIEETRATVENTARRLGYSVAEDGTLEGTPDTVDSRRSGGRWIRVLGFGR